METADLAAATGKLREQIVLFKASQIYRDIVVPRERMLARFQPMFTHGMRKFIFATVAPETLRSSMSNVWR